MEIMWCEDETLCGKLLVFGSDSNIIMRAFSVSDIKCKSFGVLSFSSSVVFVYSGSNIAVVFDVPVVLVIWCSVVNVISVSSVANLSQPSPRRG